MPVKQGPWPGHLASRRTSAQAGRDALGLTRRRRRVHRQVEPVVGGVVGEVSGWASSRSSRLFQRSVRNAARSSSENRCGCSQAAKWPPRSASWK